jgi:hypothetical protein
VILIHCCYKKRLGYRHTEREADVRTQGEVDHLQARERGLRRNRSSQHLPRLKPPEL